MIFTLCVGALIVITAIAIYLLNRLEGRSRKHSLESAAVIGSMFVLLVLIKSCNV